MFNQLENLHTWHSHNPMMTVTSFPFIVCFSKLTCVNFAAIQGVISIQEAEEDTTKTTTEGAMMIEGLREATAATTTGENVARMHLSLFETPSTVMAPKILQLR